MGLFLGNYKYRTTQSLLVLLSCFFTISWLAILNTHFASFTSHDKNIDKTFFRSHLLSPIHHKLPITLHTDNPHLFYDRCMVDDYTPWTSWKDCKIHELEGCHGKATTLEDMEGLNRTDTLLSQILLFQKNVSLVDDYILKHKDILPWSVSNFTAVLLDFRPLRRKLAFSITNVMDNLPLQWRIQVVGGASICNEARNLFPVEVAAGKLVLTDIGDRPMHKVLGWV